MSGDARRRQRKLEKKAAKRKSKHQVITKTQHLSVSERLAAAPDAPLLHCFMTGRLDNGMVNVLITRRLPNGEIACGAFLVDLYCLGVKDAWLATKSNFEYQSGFLPKMRNAEEVSPAWARKLVEKAVDYAAQLGFHPHADYHKVRAIFGNIDASACTDEFTFGRDGKPMFMSGPNDDLARYRQVVNTLTRTCGAGNFDAILAVRPGLSISAFPDAAETQGMFEQKRDETAEVE